MSVKVELEAMLRKARRYVDSAEALAARGEYDSAASRLYYAMFYCAEALLWVRGRTFSRHGALIAAFTREFVRPGLLPAELHKALRFGFEKRQAGDYEFTEEVTKADITALTANAEQFIERTEQLLRQEGHM